MENIIVSCLESKQDHLIAHVLDECELVTRILEAEKNSALSIDLTKVQNSMSLLISYSESGDGSITFLLKYSFLTLLAAYPIFGGKNSTKGWICWSYYTHSQQAHSAGQQQQHNTVTFAGLNLIVD